MLEMQSNTGNSVPTDVEVRAENPANTGYTTCVQGF